MYKEQELLIIFLYAYTIYLISLISLYSISTLCSKFQLYYFYHNRDKILSYLYAEWFS